LEIVILTLDEIEALRLADLNGLYQEQAAAEMKVSRATFARIVESARRKVADALTGGKALRLEGGSVALSPKEAQQTVEPGAGGASHCSCCPPAGGRHAPNCTNK